MIEKYEIHGYIKRTVEEDWQKLEKPIPMPVDDHEVIQALLKQAGINYFIYEVRRNKKWVEPSPSATSMDKERFGTRLGTIYNSKINSSSSETQSTEAPTDTP